MHTPHRHDRTRVHPAGVRDLTPRSPTLPCRRRGVLGLLLLGLLLAPWGLARGGGVDAADLTPSAHVRMVTKPLAPLVIQQGETLTGFSIELWADIARRLGLTYDVQVVRTVTEQLEAVQRGEADVAIAGISVTAEREHLVDFSHPYLQAGLQVLVAASRVPPLWRQLTSVLSLPFLVIGGSFFLLVLGMAHLMWLGERRHPHSHFPPRYGPGLWEALWWATVTVTTVGYGDITPKGVLGRLLAMLWMFASIFLLAHFTATMTTYTTLRALQGTITSIEDLPGKRLVTVQGSTSAQYLAQRSLTHQTVTTIDEAYLLLEQGHVEAVVYDAPVLLAYAATTGQGRVQAVGPIFAQEPYGIALALDSPYRKAINRALLALTQDGTYQRLYTRWFGHVAPVK